MSKLADSCITGIIDNLLPFFTTNSSSSLNNDLNSCKDIISFDFNKNCTFTQSHLGFNLSDFGS